MDVRDQDAAELLERLLEELREETARQTGLLESMVRKLDALERTQYS